jgi:hypothetical protein
MRILQRFIGALTTCLLAVVLSSSAQGQRATTGNGAPSGPHYNLNIIGVSKEKSADMTGNEGHRIFVGLWGKTKINLQPGADFLVLDANGTDGNGALFQLPTDVSNTYQVWARPLGKPGGKATLTTCAVDLTTQVEFCSTENYFTMREKGKQSFENVTNYLLFVYIFVDPDVNPELAACLRSGNVSTTVRVSLFDPCLQGYFWDYDNQGLKLLQLRFYAVVLPT